MSVTMPISPEVSAKPSRLEEKVSFQNLKIIQSWVNLGKFWSILVFGSLAERQKLNADLSDLKTLGLLVMALLA